MKAPADRNCLLASNDEILPGIRRMVFEDGSGAFSGALPGQFVQVEVSPGPFPVTRRPFTVDGIGPDGRLSILFEELGEGTASLAAARPGRVLRILGPLGSGWDLSSGGRWLLVGGGLGAAGFGFLASKVDCSMVLLGASGIGRLVPLPGLPVRVATEDGSSGTHGLVTDLMAGVDWKTIDHVALCGPVAMMRAAAALLPPRILEVTQVSTESRMGCGWGACEGCSIPAAGGGWLKCCEDGPVLPARYIDWEIWRGVAK